MDQQKKLYVTIGILVVLVGLLFVQRRGEQQEALRHSLEGQSQSLPKLAVTDDTVKAIDRVVIFKPAGKEGGVAEEIELVKTGEDAWSLKKPLEAKANASNVKSLLENLPKLSLSEQISDSKDEYERWGVTDDKALHATFYKGQESVLDLYFGENGSRGQMTRLGKQDGVFAIKGFSKWLYERDAKGWRDKSMLKFDDKEVVKVTVENKHGVFVFDKAGESWTGKHGKTAAQTKPIDKFQASKVDDLLRAYKSLSAIDFGDGKQPAEVGLGSPEATVRIELKGGTGMHVLQVGNTADGTNRWAKTNGSDQIYSISSWSSDWATSDVKKFQETETAQASDTVEPVEPVEPDDE